MQVPFIPMPTPFSNSEPILIETLLPHYLNEAFTMYDYSTNEVIDWGPTITALQLYNLMPHYQYRVDDLFVYNANIIRDWFIELFQLGPVNNYPIWVALINAENENKVEFARLRNIVGELLFDFEISRNKRH